MKYVITFLLIASPLFAQTDSGENKPLTEESVQEESEGSGGNKQAEDSAGDSKDQKPNEVITPFSIYKDNYLLAGYSNSDLNKELIFKFQFSAKFQMPIRGIYLAYTQRSFMDLLEDSLPFVDHNFEPEAYYIYSFSDQFTEKNWLKSVQLGYLHTSNGLDGDVSRSWERVYLEVVLKKNGFYIRPTVWVPFFKETGNQDVEKYWGYGQLQLAYVWDNDVRLSALLRLGTEIPKGSAKVDLTVPFALFFPKSIKGWEQSNLWFQVFQGHGETFLGFDESSTAIALGIGFRPDFKK